MSVLAAWNLTTPRIFVATVGQTVASTVAVEPPLDAITARRTHVIRTATAYAQANSIKLRNSF